MGNTNPSVLRSIRGPVVLMTLGALFATDYYAGYPFYRTWPVLLIVYGALWLLERVVSSRNDQGQIPGGMV